MPTRYHLLFDNPLTDIVQLLSYPTHPLYKQYVCQVAGHPSVLGYYGQRTVREMQSDPPWALDLVGITETIPLLVDWTPQLMSARDILSEYCWKQFPALRRVFVRDIVGPQMVAAGMSSSSDLMMADYVSHSRMTSFRDADTMIEYLFHCVWVANCEFGKSYSNSETHLFAGSFENSAEAVADAFSDVTRLRSRYVSLDPDCRNMSGEHTC